MPDRLRRGNSIASGNTASSTTRNTPRSIDPFITRQAEVAAAEAYLRSRRVENTSVPVQRPASSKVHRRKSQAGGRSEGSHFADARLGLRRSTSMKDDKNATKTVLQRRQNNVTEVTETSGGTTNVVTRKRAIIPPDAHLQTSQHDHLPQHLASRQRRKSQAGHTNGSPTARNTFVLGESSSALHLGTPLRADTTNDYADYPPQLPGPPTTPKTTSASAVPDFAKQRTMQDTVDVGRDMILQDFQQHKIRERKSFILGPFQKRKATNTTKFDHRNHDHSLPPFNYAADPSLAPTVIEQRPEVIEPDTINNRKSRSFSSTFKGRFTRMFRKSSKVHSGMPPQHIEASHFRYPEDVITGRESDKVTAMKTMFAGFDCNNSSSASLHAAQSIDNGRLSAAPASTAKSRVTSWTNSTIADTWSTRDGNDKIVPDERGVLKRDNSVSGLKRSDSVTTLRKATSFFGRSARNRLHRASKNDIQTSEETHGLYDALQEHIRPTKQLNDNGAELTASSERRQQREVSSTVAVLPSQRLTSSTFSNHGKFTIRSVTLEASANPAKIPETITELMSPAPTPLSKAHDSDHSAIISTPPPSSEQIARRVKMAENRWQAPLEDHLPAIRHSRCEVNPYKLSSPAAQRDDSSLPHHLRVTSPTSIPRLSTQEMLSPSVYSRGTDGASPRPDSPLCDVGTVITVTGREVRRYSISPPKADKSKHENRNPSKEWRRWLSDEFSGFGQKTYKHNLTTACSRPADTDQKVLPSADEIDQYLAFQGPSDDRADSKSPPSNSRDAVRRERPKAATRRPSSFMNDRYPMIDGSRNSSGQSVSSGARKASSALSNGQSESRLVSLPPDTSALEIEHIPSRPRAVTMRHPMAVLKTTEKAEGAPVTAETYHISAPMTSSPPEPCITIHTSPTKPPSEPPTTRARSAFDLRAKYRRNSQASARPLQVRRATAVTTKPALDHRSPLATDLRLDNDPTLQSIAAGPYAPPLVRREVTDSGRKENITPEHASSTLPALSSSEWLSARTNRIVRRAGGPTLQHPALRERDVDKGGSVAAGRVGAGSAAQKMATEFLERKLMGRESQGDWAGGRGGNGTEEKGFL